VAGRQFHASWVTNTESSWSQVTRPRPRPRLEGSKTKTEIKTCKNGSRDVSRPRLKSRELQVWSYVSHITHSVYHWKRQTLWRNCQTRLESMRLCLLEWRSWRKGCHALLRQLHSSWDLHHRCLMTSQTHASLPAMSVT